MRLSVSGVVACGGRLLVCRGHGAGRSKASRDGLLCASRRLSAAAVSIGSTGGITQRAIEGHGKMHAPFGLYSHAVKVEVAGNAGEAAAAPALLLSSGQLATEIDGSIPSGCAAQVRTAYMSLQLQKGCAALCALARTARRCDVTVLRQTSHQPAHQRTNN